MIFHENDTPPLYAHNTIADDFTDLLIVVVALTSVLFPFA